MTDPTAAPRPQLAALGPFCAFETHAEGSELTAPWRTLSEVTEESSDALRERIASVRATLAANHGRPHEAVEPRVAASVAVLGLVARVIAPFLGLAALHGLPSRPLTLDDLRYGSALGGAFRLSLPRETVTPTTDGDTRRPVNTLADELLSGPIHALVAAFAPYSVSPHILLGNVASAVNGAATGITAAAPSLKGPARATALAFLQQPQLRDAHTLATPNGRFTRRSCCLLYRAAPDAAGAMCGDCVLLHERGGRGGRSRTGR